MRWYFTRKMARPLQTKYKLSLLILCLSLSLAVRPLPTVAEPPPTKEAGEGLFERMIIDKITSIESNLKELTQKVENIEKRLSRVERGLVARPAGPPLTSQGGATPPVPQEPPKKRLKDTNIFFITVS